MYDRKNIEALAKEKVQMMEQILTHLFYMQESLNKKDMPSSTMPTAQTRS